MVKIYMWQILIKVIFEDKAAYLKYFSINYSVQSPKHLSLTDFDFWHLFPLNR